MIDFITTNWIISLWTVLLVIVFFFRWMGDKDEEIEDLKEEIKNDPAGIDSLEAKLNFTVLEVKGENRMLKQEIKELKEQIKKLKEDK